MNQRTQFWDILGSGTAFGFFLGFTVAPLIWGQEVPIELWIVLAIFGLKLVHALVVSGPWRR